MKRSLLTVIAILLSLGIGLSASSALVSPLTASAPANALRVEPVHQAPTIGVLVAHASPVLGYRIELPEGYRLSRALVLPAAQGQGMVGHDGYVPRSEADELELCLRSKDGGPQARAREFDVRIEAHRDVSGTSISDWIQSTGQAPLFTTTETLTVNGYDAARVVHKKSGDTALYVIRANDRFYVITRELHAVPSSQPKGWMDQIATTFTAIPAIDAAPTLPKSPC